MYSLKPRSPAEQVQMSASGFTIRVDEFDGRGLRRLLGHAEPGDPARICRLQPVGGFRLGRISEHTVVSRVGEAVITLESTETPPPEVAGWAILEPPALGEADLALLTDFCNAGAARTVAVLGGPLFVVRLTTGDELARELAVTNRR